MLDHEDEYLLRRLVKALRGKELPWQHWMDGFLRELERNPENVSAAIDLCKVSRNTVYKYRRRNSEFARRWAEIVQGVAAEPPRQEPTVSQPRRTGHCLSSAPARGRHRPHLNKIHRSHGGRNEPT